ncbi:SepM family pheromone-processing serine protease [Paenibacillus pini]
MKRKYIWGASVFLIFMIVMLIPLPYYLYQPGDVNPLSPIVSVEGGHKSEKGNFYLTTVASIKVSHLYYLLYALSPDTEIRKEKSVKGDLTQKEYNFMLNHMMTKSQQNAIVSGLRGAGEKVPVQNKGVFITNILPISQAKGKLSIGDIITEVDGHKMEKSTDVIAYLSSKKAGESVRLTYEHEGKIHKDTFQLVVINKSGQVGLGINPEDEYIIKPSRNVNMDTKDIGGPSAGLMFSLEILNQIVPGDLTKGYEIAGTGTIDQNGNVGQIGGIRDKIIAAHHGKIDIFFCPADINPGDMNTKDILDEAKKKGYNIRIIPVKTMQEALDFLKALPSKAA